MLLGHHLLDLRGGLPQDLHFARQLGVLEEPELLLRWATAGGLGLDAAVAAKVDDMDAPALERGRDQQAAMAPGRIFLGA